MRRFLTAALAALALACTPLSAAWAACAPDDTACQRAELADLAAELNTIADSFRDRGNAGAERKWRSAALAVEGNDGGISLADAKSWLAASNRNGWGTGKRLLPKVIEAIESLPALVALEAQQAKQQGQGDDPPQQGEIGSFSQQAEIVFDGTIPVHSKRASSEAGTPNVILRVGDDGTLTGTGLQQGFDPVNLPSVCIDPAKGCTAGRPNPNGWIVRKGQSGQAFTRTYAGTTTYEWSDGHTCTPGVDCDQGQRLYVKAGGNSGPLVYIGRQYSTHPYWSYFRKNNPRKWSPITRYNIFDSDGNNVTGKMGGNLIFNKNGAPYRVATKYNRVETLNPGEIQRWFVAARKNGDNDYTSFGYWFSEGYFARSGEGYAVRASWSNRGVFAGGTNPATDVSGVAGTATYDGEAAGTVLWRDVANRRSTYDGAPVTITADFDAMRMDTTIDLAGRVHEPGGCTAAAGCLQQWRDVGPETIRFRDVRMNADGTFSGGAVYADPEFRTEVMGHTKNTDGTINQWADGTPWEGYTKVVVTSPSIADVNQSKSRFDGRFYVPDGNNAPGQAAGTFYVHSVGDVSDSGFYHVLGAFGTVKQ